MGDINEKSLDELTIIERLLIGERAQVRRAIRGLQEASRMSDARAFINGKEVDEEQ